MNIRATLVRARRFWQAVGPRFDFHLPSPDMAGAIRTRHVLLDWRLDLDPFCASPTGYQTCCWRNTPAEDHYRQPPFAGNANIGRAGISPPRGRLNTLTPGRDLFRASGCQITVPARQYLVAT